MTPANAAPPAARPPFPFARLLAALPPRTLRGRVVLVLACGMVLIQIVSMLYVVTRGGPFVYSSVARQAAMRLAGQALLLDAARPDVRTDMIGQMVQGASRIALTATPPITPHGSMPPSEVSGAPGTPGTSGTPGMPALAADVYSAIFADHLRGLLAPDMQLVCRVDGIARDVGRRPPPPPGRADDGHYDIGYTVGIRLRDGMWAVFTHVLPGGDRPWIPHPMLWDLGWRIVGVALLGLIVVGWMTRPLRMLADAADEFGAGLVRAPLPERGPLEIRRAAQAFNRMQDRIRQFVDERGRLLAAISHDLRTPVTRMRLRADQVEPPELRERFLTDLDEIRDLLSTTIDFVRSTDSREATAAVDVAALLESLAEDCLDLHAGQTGQTIQAGQAGQTPLRITVHGTAEGRPTHIQAQPLALKRCLSNLLENAVRYGGGQVDVEVRDTGDTLTVAIRDRGPGLPEHCTDKVFEPFFRVEHSRNRQTGGSGLGLSIARNIARQHGGDIILANREGGGLEALLHLPRVHRERT
ncbi:ATP-binding protein [Nitratidesulfovibrio sp. SRB-5]|uniref:ATP-binding protein n=1 Tax=Nitratidesulfovibrio sp. SRB-5 TaxID=2872636 RepID=UPI0010283D25|nr:ATP-binding protein [Nitratidesulfovibrio sp. SRB-5]MBZ2172213.1 HAMP domain-containing protein [Nitratidesulfovibrio sp. SRB-5]RXF77404.1 HAMP domain-containing protein [Desulfovibrio sp. DS-1]